MGTNCHLNNVIMLCLLMSQTERCRTCNNSPFAHCRSQFLQRVSEIILLHCENLATYNSFVNRQLTFYPWLLK